MAWSLAFAGDDGVEGTVELALDATRARYRAELVLPAGAGPEGVVVVHDDDVPLPRGAPAVLARSRLLEVRSDGLWAEVVHEDEDHWAFALEAFGLRFDTLEEARTSDVGERVPVGLDLEWDRGRVVGEILVGRARVAVDTTGTFTET
jgi:hypothetical protein